MTVLFLACSRSGLYITGTTTETNTSTVAAMLGHISYGDGTPVSNADIILHNQQNVTATALGKIQASVRSGRTKSDSDGFFRFNSVDTGQYLIEANDRDIMGVLLKTEVRPGDTLVEVNGTVGDFGSIEGKVDTADFKHPGNVTIRLPEIERMVRANNDGSFVFDSLPVWDYVLRGSIGDTLLSLVTDTLTIPVSPDTVTHVNVRSKKGKILD
jgi:hypothetical protein